MNCKCCGSELVGKGKKVVADDISYGPYCDSCYGIVADEKSARPTKKPKTTWTQGPDGNSRMQRRSGSSRKGRQMGLAELKRYEFEKRMGIPHINKAF